MNLTLYRGAYTGPQVDQAISRSLIGGELDKKIDALKAAVGSPLQAATVAEMTDHNRIYVYTGSEVGYVNGDWYYWDGTAWVSGGEYLSPGYTFDDDPTEGSDNPVKSGGIFDAIEAALEEAKTAVAAVYPTDTSSGAVAYFTDGADGVAVKDAVIDIPYSAGGYTGLTLTTAPKNLCDRLNGGGRTNPYTSSGVTVSFDEATGEITISTVDTGATSNVSWTVWSVASGVPTGNLKLDETYHISGVPTNTHGVYMYFSNYSGSAYRDTGNGADILISSVPGNLNIRIPSGAVITTPIVVKPMVRLASTDAAWAYGYLQTVMTTVDWADDAGTIYGGSFDPVTGVLTSAYAADGSAITPVTYQLDPVSMLTNYGENTVWTDVGDIAVTYRADTALYIQKIIGG